MPLLDEFRARGWLVFPAERVVADWASCALAPALSAAHDLSLAHWLRCGGTWFVGVDALPNDAAGRVEGGPPLEGAAISFIRDELQFDPPLHKAQVSICYRGYPKPYEGESEQAFRYRLTRDAAHVDGLHAEGPERRRHLKEPHGYILGLALNPVPPEAAPLVVWDGSHSIMGNAFRSAFGNLAPAVWPETDVTEVYQEARRTVFATCRRIPLPARPGEATLLHRHLLHGVAPWPETVPGPDDGRMIAYFRPELRNIASWLGD
jgi:hypothetical protein